MSTISKLDAKRIRDGRARRGAVVAEMRQLTARLPKAEQRSEAYALLGALELIRRSTRLTGAQKDSRFAALMQSSPLFAK